jgi:hypothetical protein
MKKEIKIRQKFSIWERCWTCNKWKLKRKMLWIFTGKDPDFWEARCFKCEKSKLSTKS